MKKILLLILLVAGYFDTQAQVAEEDYYPFQNNFSEEYRPMIEVDTTLFYRAVGAGGDLFGRVTDFKFSFVSYRRRGEAWRAEDGLSLDGIRLSSRYGAAFRALSLGREASGRSLRTNGGEVDFPTMFRSGGETALPSRSVSGQFSGRGYLGGLRFSIVEELGRGWDMAASVQGRTGRDLFVEGVFSQALTVGVKVSKRFRKRSAVVGRAGNKPREWQFAAGNSSEPPSETASVPYSSMDTPPSDMWVDTGGTSRDDEESFDSLALAGKDRTTTELLPSSFVRGLGDEDRGTLSIVVVAGPQMRSLRSASSREAFSLVGNNLYNPAWGYQDGKVRSARIRREIVPLALVNYRVGLWSSTSLSVSMAAEAGIRKLSSLSWFNARSPLPDNYREMPSYQDELLQQSELEAIWRANDTRYTQIDWDRMYEVNRHAKDGHAAFAVVDRAERVTGGQLNAEGETWFGERLSVRYGVHGGYRAGRHYLQMRDLMGGDHIVDHDYFLVDEATYSNRYQNNLRDPDRKIRRGDRFGYDYALRQWELGVGGSLDYRTGRLALRFEVGVSEQEIWRQGYYEKEIFAGNGSYGRSRTMRFTPYAVGASAGYAVSARHHVALSLGVTAGAPYARDLFLNPDYNNRTVARPAMETVYRSELDWSWTGRAVEMRASLFALRSSDGGMVRRYYDDAAGVFSDMAAAGVGTLRYGVEVAGVFRLARRWTLSVAGAAGQYKYADDPRVTVYDDADNSLIDNDARAHMGGCYVGGAPQVAAFAGINYYGPKGWGVRMDAAWVGARYVDPTPLRRTARIGQALAESPEALRIITRQERLADASSLDVTLFKSFYFETSRLTIMASVRNLLGFRDQVLSGYESMRVPRVPVGDSEVYRPMATRYTYAYPRTFFVGIYFTF